MGIKQLIAGLNVKLRGHYNYYGITFNAEGIAKFFHQVRRKIQKWLNRRGGKSIWSWDKILLLLNQWVPVLRPKIYHKIV